MRLQSYCTKLDDVMFTCILNDVYVGTQEDGVGIAMTVKTGQMTQHCILKLHARSRSYKNRHSTIANKVITILKYYNFSTQKFISLTPCQTTWLDCFVVSYSTRGRVFELFHVCMDWVFIFFSVFYRYSVLCSLRRKPLHSQAFQLFLCF